MWQVDISLITLCMIACCLGTASGKTTTQCLDESGNPVDWFVIYKLPKEESDPRDNVKNGVAYLYLDVNNQQFALSPNSIANRTGAVYYTLNQLYSQYDTGVDLGYGFYNDEEPDGHYSSYRGHTKGAVGFDTSTGFWLIESVPKFPNFIELGYEFPESGETYGQSMLCITTALESFNTIGSHFMYTYPQSYSVNINESIFGSTVPNLVDAFSGKHISTEPYFNTFYIKSIGGTPFTLYSHYKSAEFDIVSVQMAPGTESSLNSETWRNGINPLPTNCTGTYDAINVLEMQFPHEGIRFKQTKDHSKWASAIDNDWMCIGDLNRQESQESRCGGYVCWQNSDVNGQYNDAVLSTDPCPDSIK